MGAQVRSSARWGESNVTPAYAHALDARHPSQRPAGPLTTAALLLGLIGLIALPVLAAPAHADPVPAPYSASTHGDILVLDAQVTGSDFAGLQVAHADTTVSSEASPRTRARAENIDDTVPDVPVTVSSVTQTAPPDNAGPTSSGLTQVDIPMLLDTGPVSGTAHARCVGDAACLPDGEPLATSTTSMPGPTLAVPGVPPLVPDAELAQLGAASTTGTTTLESNGGANDARSGTRRSRTTHPTSRSPDPG